MLAIILAFQSILNAHWAGAESLLKLLVAQLLDTGVRDHLVATGPAYDCRSEVLKTSTYVVE
ncbi:MAG: hypothetical protein EOO60_07310 [Hymenobacter sp.]|nr:MAG: hypothetical protein EOO60_07310 [Hymenobacter sp.]